MSAQGETLTLGGGCFWCLEAVFEQLRGVQRVGSGYSGGTAPAPAYRQDCTGTTGQAVADRAAFDPADLT